MESGKRAYRDFAIFVRVNALSRALESAFINQRVPYQIVRGLAFFERKENRDILAYLRLLLNPRDDLSFLRAVNEPARGVGKVSLEHLRQYAEPRQISLLSSAADVAKIPAIKGKAAAGLRDFSALMTELRKWVDAPPDDVIRQVLDQSGYRKMLQESKDPEDEERLANIEELITAARQFTAEDESRTIVDFLETIALSSDVDGWDERQDCVAVMTLHAAKGLEFPVVYMVAVEHGLLPHERSQASVEELEEERRLAFVGMTRAMEELYLSHSRVREFRGSTQYVIASEFLEELPSDAVEVVDLSSGGAAIQEWRSGSQASAEAWEEAGVDRAIPLAASRHRGSSDGADGPHYAAGMLVRHDIYGHGRVIEVSGFGIMRKVKVRFSGMGEKTFIINKAKLAIVGKK